MEIWHADSLTLKYMNLISLIRTLVGVVHLFSFWGGLTKRKHSKWVVCMPSGKVRNSRNMRQHLPPRKYARKVRTCIWDLQHLISDYFDSKYMVYICSKRLCCSFHVWHARNFVWCLCACFLYLPPYIVYVYRFRTIFRSSCQGWYGSVMEERPSHMESFDIIVSLTGKAKLPWFQA